VIPLFDLRLTEDDVQAVIGALRTGEPRVEAFEGAFAQHLGARHAIAVSSCTAALHLAYLAAGVGPGDEVIVPSLTFVATAAAAVYCGARPVFADIAPDDLSLDPEDVARRITPRTKAVCAVHFAGYPARTDELKALGVTLLEDSAHAPHLPVHGRAAAYSFFSNKVLACGRAGSWPPTTTTSRSAPVRPAGTSATASTTHARRCCSPSYRGCRPTSLAGAS
jgi:dTDP-4-amino-4,6-dideoxygalactose transaminase